MAFNPSFQEVFEEYALDNLMYAVDQNMQAYLDGFYPPNGTLLTFAEKTLGNIIRLNFPALAIDPSRFTENESESGHYLEGEFRITAHLAVADPDPAAVTRKLFKYVRAFKALVRAMRLSDWLRNVTAGPTTPMALYVDISGEYGQPAKNPNKTNEYIRHVDLQLTLRFSER